MQTITTTAYEYDELTDAAKKRAREWYRDEPSNTDWQHESEYECVCEDAKSIAAILGIKITSKILYTLFVQGSGASFYGTYFYEKGSRQKIRDYAPLDTALHTIADDLYSIQRPAFYGLGTQIRPSWRGHWLEIDDERLRGPLVAFANWTYRQLLDAALYVSTDEYIEESIRANEYLFTAEGRRRVTL